MAAWRMAGDDMREFVEDGAVVEMITPLELLALLLLFASPALERKFRIWSVCRWRSALDMPNEAKASVVGEGG